MKKLISVLLAVSALALSTSAFAAPAVSDRNPNATTLAEAATGTLPCFRNGDTVTFALSGLAGDQLTLISSKVGATADNSTIQYINQYTISEDDNGNKSISYTVRELTNGTYNILVKDGDAAVVSYYYNVANPEVALGKLTADSTDYIVAKSADGTEVSYAAVASVEGASFTESGVTSVGFTFEDGDGKTATSDTLTAAQLDSMKEEVSGRLNVVYGITITGVTGGTSITPTAVMN